MGFRNNICVVGAGQWGNNHIRTLDILDALKGIVEPDLDVLHKFLHKYPGVSGHTNLSEALKEEGAHEEILSVCSTVLSFDKFNKFAIKFSARTKEQRFPIYSFKLFTETKGLYRGRSFIF